MPETPAPDNRTKAQSAIAVAGATATLAGLSTPALAQDGGASAFGISWPLVLGLMVLLILMGWLAARAMRSKKQKDDHTAAPGAAPGKKRASGDPNYPLPDLKDKNRD